MGTYILLSAVLVLVLGLVGAIIAVYKRIEEDLQVMWNELLEAETKTHEEMLDALKVQKKELANMMNVKLYGKVPDPEVANDRTAYEKEERAYAERNHR